MKVQVSIIVPVYNVQDYVLRCLRSLGRQKYRDIEIIIVDDGSIDESGRICDDFAKHEKRAKVFHKKNGGLSDARNFGMKKASGELVAFVDSDDYVDENYIERMVETLVKYDGDIVVCGYNRELAREEVVSGIEATYNCLVRQDNIDIVVWNKLYKRALFTDNGIVFPKGEKHEDLLTTYKIMSKADRVCYIRESLYHYDEGRVGSITSEEMIETKLKAREGAAKEAIQYFKDDEKCSSMARVSLLLAKYAYIDAYIKGRVDKNYYIESMDWLRQNLKSYSGNKYLTNRLKIYNILNTLGNGIIYRILRRVL